MRHWIPPFLVITVVVAALDLGLITNTSNVHAAVIRILVAGCVSIGYVLIVAGLVVLGAVRLILRVARRHRRPVPAEPEPRVLTLDEHYAEAVAALAGARTAQYPVVITDARWPAGATNSTRRSQWN